MPGARSLRLVALVTGVLFPVFAHSAELFFGAEVFDHDFTESAASGARLVNESGRMFAPVIGIEHAFSRGLILALEYWSADGSLDYAGATQSGRPLFTTVRQDFTRTSGTAGYRLDRGQWFARFDASYSDWRWNRHIEETAISLPLTVDYDWDQWSLGFEFGREMRWGRVSANLEILRNGNAESRLDLEAYGAGQVVLEPGDDGGGRLTLAHRHRWAERWSSTHYLYLEQQGFAASETVGVSSGNGISLFTEPASETERLGIGVVIEYALRR